MNNKEKIFDDTFKILLSLTVTTWVIYGVFLLFAGENRSCQPGPPEMILSALAIATGVLAAPPLVYGFVRLLFWPKSPKNTATWIAAWVIGVGMSVFIAAAILFALAVSQYGCR